MLMHLYAKRLISSGQKPPAEGGSSWGINPMLPVVRRHYADLTFLVEKLDGIPIRKSAVSVNAECCVFSLHNAYQPSAG